MEGSFFNVALMEMIEMIDSVQRGFKLILSFVFDVIGCLYKKILLLQSIEAKKGI